MRDFKVSDFNQLCNPVLIYTWVNYLQWLTLSCLVLVQMVRKVHVYVYFPSLKYQYKKLYM